MDRFTDLYSKIVTEVKEAKAAAKRPRRRRLRTEYAL